jgi:hypothetical protein
MVTATGTEWQRSRQRTPQDARRDQDDAVNDAPNESGGLICRQIQLDLQDLVASEDFKNHGQKVRFVVRNLRRELRDALEPGEISRGCFGCIVSQFAHKKVAIEDQKVCGTHDVCEVGEALDPSDSSCAAQICATLPACCSQEWSATCVGAVTSVCNDTCGGGTTTTRRGDDDDDRRRNDDLAAGDDDHDRWRNDDVAAGNTTTIGGGTTTLPPVTTTTIVAVRRRCRR